MNADPPPPSPPANLASRLIAVELALGLLGAWLARWQDVSLPKQLSWSAATAAWTVAGLAPLLAMLAVAVRTRWGPMARLRSFVQEFLGQALRGARWWELALLAAAAGIGEEVLFRGALQPLVARWWGTPAAVAAVSLVFGAVHAATVAYFLLATVFGLYLGALAAATGDLTAVILIHALYDWAALAWLDRSKDEPPRTAPPDQAETDAP